MRLGFAKTSRSRVRARRLRAFTLLETALASGVVGIFVAICTTSIVFDRVSVRKAKEEALVMDFLTHYAENLKALPFTSLVPGYPVNSLYDGSNGAPHVAIPSSGTWVAIDNSNYQVFDPDLVWLANRSPVMMVTLNSNSVITRSGDGTVTSPEININLRVDWNAPLSKGGAMEVQLDLLRTPTL